MCGHVGLGRVSGEVRKNPREPATPRGSAKKKTNRRTGWSSVVVVDGSPLRNFLFALNHASEYQSVNAS
jgi:hypothetical protein